MMTLTHCVVSESSKSLMLFAVATLILLSSSCGGGSRDPEPEIHTHDTPTRLHQRPYRNGPED